MNNQQIEITSSIPLHDEEGYLSKEGWARSPYWQYDRSNLKASKFRIKEWDYYSVLSPDGEFGITFTMSDLGYAGLFAICFLDFKKKTFQQVDTLSILPLGKTNFPSKNNIGQVSFSDKKLSLKFTMTKGIRTLEFSSPLFKEEEGGKGLEGTIVLTEPEDLESMTIATSWKENRRAFYYNTKINCMPASGGFRFGNKTYSFDPKKNFGALDWGRGVWTYKNRWYWSSGSGLIGEKPFGFNLGYGFSDRSPASENVLIYENKIHKLDLVSFQIDTKNYLAPWKFTSNDNRLDLDFTPIVDRSSCLNLGILKSIQHQVFGLFNGSVFLDSGERVELKNFLGFAEDVLNHY
ncbi:MAG TPA: DUF2804 domain-containing protein [Leptospiraceae bacterium]|nr:DUF2804 domain-containing protein [Leptospiraceae bacterium]HMW03576.1 DUF2804 domain-containing protein [Leptospiraceae bacterium]HMX32317.1 DUF2804 domain-containing protein [Leptospiraceae bacterium]HMY29503.1 DUF2804 domain-containing protein [Leptospiraceae bacterium]HMZ63576.1 DUF2804 domain-containing protein [Leptospiraceae bacterium]